MVASRIKLQLAPDTPQRLAIVIERNKAESWSIACYLVRADGLRERQTLTTCKKYRDATKVLERLWNEMSV